jgi:amidophosphoribosyltransferase
MLFEEGQSFSEIIDGKVNLTELVAKLIIRGKDIVDGIDSMFSLISGSCSLLILTPEGIYAARDRHGYFPLILGRKDGSIAVTTETAAFYNLGFSVTKYLQPGEIVMLGENGAETKHSGNGHTQVCSFLWIYTGFPASAYEGITRVVGRLGQGVAD